MDYALKDAIRGLEFTESELRTLEWISGWERQTIDNIAMIIKKTRAQTVTNLKDRGQLKDNTPT